MADTDETTKVTQAAKTLADAPAIYAEDAAQTVKVDAEKETAAWEKEVETWFNDLRQNLTALDTEIHNKLFAAKKELKARLTAIL